MSAREFSEIDKRLALQMVMAGDAAEIAVRDSWGEIDFEHEIVKVAEENGYDLETFRTICLRKRQDRREGRI